MREWLIKILGGITKNELATLVAEQCLNRIDYSEKEFLREELRIERTRVDELQNIILRHVGIIKDESNRQNQPISTPPISTRRQSWPRLRENLEKQDAVEKHWREKGAVPVSELKDAS